MKTCRRCNATKPIDSFATKRNYCRPCYSAVRGREYGARGRKKGASEAARALDLLSISCEWWTPEGLAARLDCHIRTARRALQELHDAGQLRRRERPLNEIDGVRVVWEYQADPFWVASDTFMPHPFGMLSPDQEGEAA